MSSSQFFQSFVLPVTEVSATGNVSTSSSTFAVITSMTITPVAGVYLVSYSGSADISGDDEGEVAIFLGGAQQTHTTREISADAAGILGATCSIEIAVHTQAKLTADGTQAIDVRHRAISGTLISAERSLHLFPVV